MRCKEKTSYFTTWSLVHPVDSCRDFIGRSDVIIYANSPELPGQVMFRLKQAFEQSNSGSIHPLLAQERQQAEKARIPLGIILGKG